MDALAQERSFLHHAIEILVLTPVLAYAATEILVCLAWNLATRSLQGLYSLVFHGFDGNCKHGAKDQQKPLKDGNSSQNYQASAQTTLLHNDTNSWLKQNTQTGIKSRLEKDLSWSSQNEFRCRKKISATMDKLQAKEEQLNVQRVKTKAGKDERTSTQKPWLIKTQWVTQNKGGKGGRNTVNKEKPSSHRNSNVHCRSDFEGRHEKEVVYHKGKMFLRDSEDQECFLGEKQSEDGLSQEMLGWKLRRRSVKNQNCERPLNERIEAKRRGHLRLDESLCYNAKKNVTGYNQDYKPLLDLSGVAEEKGYSSELVFPGRAKGKPVFATESPVTATHVRKRLPVSTTLDVKISNVDEDTSKIRRYHSLSTANHSIITKVIETSAYQEVETPNIRPRHQPAKTTRTATKTVTTGASEEIANPFQTTISGLKEARTNQAIKTKNYNFLAAQDHLVKTTPATTAKAAEMEIAEDETKEKRHVFSKGCCSHLETKSSQTTDNPVITLPPQEKLLINAPEITASTSSGEARAAFEVASSCGDFRDKSPCTTCGPTCSSSLFISNPTDFYRDIKQAEVMSPLNAVLHQPQINLAVHKPKGEIPGKCDYPLHPCEIQQENQKGEKVTNSSKLRQGQVKRSRLPFARVPRRMDLRKHRMPVL